MSATQEHGSGELLDTIIVGGGQAGLALGYHLARQGHRFVILDAHQRVGDAWRLRWDSLRLFTPAKYDGLPGMPFPGDRLSFPSKDEQADYLEAYAQHFDLPVRLGVYVDRLWQETDRYIVTSNGHRWEAKNAVVATGGCQSPKIPAFAAELAPSIVQLHSNEYISAARLQPGRVLVVGVGNSGAEIALDVSRTHPTSLAGRPSAELPVRHGRNAARFFLPIVRFLGLHVLTLNTPIGRKAAPGILAKGDPLIRTKLKDLAAAGVEFVPRVTGVQGGKPVAGEGQPLDVANVIWCTGFRDDFAWVEPRVFGEDGRPRQRRGVAEQAPGLYFLGQEFLFAAMSATLPGDCRDARYLAGKIPVTSHGPAVQSPVKALEP